MAQGDQDGGCDAGLRAADSRIANAGARPDLIVAVGPTRGRRSIAGALNRGMRDVSSGTKSKGTQLRPFAFSGDGELRGFDRIPRAVAGDTSEHRA